MSTKNQKARYIRFSGDERHHADEYPTPSGFTNVVLDFLDLPASTHIWEPCAGGGHIVRALWDRGYDNVTYDDLHYNGVDFLDLQPGDRECDWVVTNPPYKIAEQFVRGSLLQAREGVAMLMQTAFLESIGRGEGLFAETPPAHIILNSRRMKLINGTSSIFNHVWLVWRTGHGGPPTFHWAAPTGDVRMPTGVVPGVWDAEFEGLL